MYKIKQIQPWIDNKESNHIKRVVQRTFLTEDMFKQIAPIKKLLIEIDLSESILIICLYGGILLSTFKLNLFIGM